MKRSDKFGQFGCTLGVAGRFVRAVSVLVLAALSGMGGAAFAAPAGRTTNVEYNRDVRPILSDNCFLCHGPDKNTRKAKLRLDLRDEAIKSGVIVPGKPAESPLVERVFSSDAEEMMPPPESHKHLTAAQKETLKRWIAGGAEYQAHWAYVKPSRPEVPIVRKPKRVANAIDAFIVRSLDDHGWVPSSEADQRTLLRRLSLDLIGLPPTPEQMAAFLADRRPDAYERQVERLLSSPHYGERMAVPWLDTARFTDTVGYHGDQNQRIFPYRDYVINAFNRNLRFDQFTIEQLAGDLLPNPTVEQRIATGFNRLNMMTREGGAQPKEYLAKYAADRVRTVATTWLGSTMGCCECHDHKFDPFTMRDFYSMSAFFADVKQWGVYQDYKYTPNPELKDWSNEHPFPPELEVESEPLRRRATHLRGEIQDVFQSFYRATMADRTGSFVLTNWEQSVREFLSARPDGWEVLEASLLNSEPPVVMTITNVIDGITNLVRKTNAPARTVTAETGRAFRVALGGKKEDEKVEFVLATGRVAALRVERLPRARENGSLRLSAVVKHGSRETKVAFYRAEASHQEPRYSNGDEVLGILDGWRPSSRHSKLTQTGVWRLEPPLEVREGDRLQITFRSTGPLTARVAVSPLGDLEPGSTNGPGSLQAALQTSRPRRPGDEAVLGGAYLLATQVDPTGFAQVKKLQTALAECRDGKAHTLITVAAPPMVTRVLPRGNWQNESGDLVEPSPPRFLMATAPIAARAAAGSSSGDEMRLTRLDLARWLVSRENPLTARAIMNRLWKQFFGTGLSAVVDDLGGQGEWPVHPALLDWLAVEFMESGWDIKHMVRLVVMSRTYRQEANLRRELLESDPQNRWLASQNPRRLEAEFVRDNALFVAGLLNLEMGGPSVRPYQPGGYYANLQFPDRDYQAQADDRQYRRGVYMHWQRTFPHPMLANFDAPAREECTATRVVSNTPQQALTLLNDPTFVEAARVFAAKLLAAGGKTDRAKITTAYQAALGRAPKSRELGSLESFLAEQRAHYGATPTEADALLKVGLSTVPAGLDHQELAAWTQLGRVVLNLQEGITKY